MSLKIRDILGREVLDSRGYPTVEVDVILESGHFGRMMVPSGASKGKHEALDLRDKEKRFNGKGVRKAVHNINTKIRDILIGVNAEYQEYIDYLIIGLDGTSNKSNLGANATLGVSLAVAHAAAKAKDKSLYNYISEKYLPKSEKLAIPVPMVNLISGGMHAGGNIDLQDFLIIPLGANSYNEALEMLSLVYWKTQEVLSKKGYNAFLFADEGGFGPALRSNREALDILCEVFMLCGYKGGKDIAIALDVAASHFYDEDKKRYNLQSEGVSLDSTKMIEMLSQWVEDYPIISIEDGLAEDDWEGWMELTSKLGRKIQLVGDDLFTTNIERISKGVLMQAGNAVLIKMNQIGTLTETAKAIKMAKTSGFRTVISARSGETEDSTIADLAVGFNCGQIKIGSLSGSSRLSKYNQLLRINNQLNGKYWGNII